jgi:hypothetical protein
MNQTAFTEKHHLVRRSREDDRTEGTQHTALYLEHSSVWINKQIKSFLLHHSMDSCGGEEV